MLAPSSIGDPMSEAEHLSAAANRSSPSGRGLWALGFVAVSLIVLVAVPSYFGRRAAEMQALIVEVLDPASRRSNTLLLLKARQMALVDGFLLTGDRVAFREPYSAAIAEEDSIFAELSDLSRELDARSGGPPSRDRVFERVSQLTDESAVWRFENRQVFETGPSDAAIARVRERYRELQRATRDLDEAIAARVVEGRNAMADQRTSQTRITLGLALIALCATLIVGRVGYRYRDLTAERERRRREAERARREIDLLLEATGDGVLGIDLNGRCISLNRAGSELLGYTEREIRGRDVHATLYHSYPDASPCPRESSEVLSALTEGRALDSEDGAVLWRRRAVAFPARWSLRPMIDGTELRGAVLTFTDMTEIHEKEEALRRAIRQREDVVSIVSHDLRNPLGVALAAADLLIDLPLDEGQRRRQAEIIVRSGKRMQNLIEDLLDLARIEAGALVIRPSLEKLAPILEEARRLFTDQADERGISLGVDTAGTDPQARVDRDRIMQALANLLDNAIRLTPEGGQVVLAAVEGPEFVRVTVTDTGPGIAPELLDRLFDRFSQSDGAHHGGAGLGLAIVSGVAVAHGGEASVTSELGSGTSFALVLPKRGPPAGGESGMY